MASDKLIRAGVIFINVSADNLKKADRCIWVAMAHWLGFIQPGKNLVGKTISSFSKAEVRKE